MIRTSIELFEIVAASPEQAQDAGWYFQRKLGPLELGDPQGPFDSDTKAIQAAVSASVYE